MKKRIGLWVILAILLSGPSISVSPEADALIKRVLTRNFLNQYNLFDGRFILKTKEQLKLTPVQEKKIEKLMLTFEELSISRCAEIKINELHLASAIKSDGIDRKKIENHIRQISNKKIDLSIAYLNYLLDIKMILTDSQLALLSEIKRQNLLHLKKRPIRHHQEE